MHFVPTVREKDKAVIMAAVRRFGPLSRVGIHDLTKLRPATISLLVRDLLKQGKLQVAGRADNPTGRKQILLRVNEESGLVIGVDFDEEFVDVALMNLHPAIMASVREPIHLSGGVDGLIHQLFSCVHRLIQRPGVEKRRIRGIGVGVTGLINSREGSVIMSSTIEFWKQVPLKQLFEQEFGFPTVVENNCRTKAVAERILGAGEMAEDMIYLEYGRGIGTGIIVRGKVLHGHRFSAGEFGHTHILEDGPACKCGSFGCLEAIASIEALEARIHKAVAEGGLSHCLKLAEGDPAKIDGWMVLKAGGLGDKLCRGLVDELGRHLGLGLANLVNLFNPSVIVLDYRLESAGQQLLEQICRTISIQALSYSSEDLVVRFGKLCFKVGLLGAGLLVTEKIFEVPLLKPPRFMIDSAAHPLARPSFQSYDGESDVDDPTRAVT
jgi:predicted NBD/HSP70 family sugar kinase